MRRSRWFWLSCALIAYICFAALRAEGGMLPLALSVALPLALAEVWRRTGMPRGGEDRSEPTVRSALRAALVGGALWLAARSGPAGSSAFDAAANLGSGISCIAALVALARIGSVGGVLLPHPATRSLDAAAFAGLLWGIAVAVPATAALLSTGRARLDPLAIDYATTTAGIGGLLVLVASAWRLKVLRRLELGVGDRASGAIALALTAVSIAVPAAAFDVAPPDRVLPVAVVLAAIACTWCATTPEPTTVSSTLRGILAVTLLGAPATLAAGLLARSMPQHAGAVVLAGCSVGIVVGLIARAVARPLGPEQSRWLDAIDAATHGALQPEPDAAMRAALMALSRASSSPGARPELWENDPEQVLSVDIAGYLHVEKAQAPARLYELALGEPERTLRAEVLRTLEVRRPDLRPLLAWFDARRAFSATVIVEEDGPLGFILLPRGNRSSPMTLEEARAVRNLADRISALLSVSSALARSRERELTAVERADRSDDEKQRLEHIIRSESTRHEAAAERLARRVRSTAYSPAARQCLERLEKLGRLGVPLTLVVPPGVDPQGWAALAHLASARAGGPLVFAEGGNATGQSMEIWAAERSPLSLADGGTLVLLDLVALPAPVQEGLTQKLAQRSAAPVASAIVRAGLIATAPRPMANLVAEGRVTPALARWLGDASVELPALAERAEDLRTLVLDRLIVAGLSKKGEPLGIHPAALRLLTEHDFPANETELEDILLRAAAVADGPVVTADDLTAIGFVPSSHSAPSLESSPSASDATPLPTPAVVARRRPRPRAVRRR